MTLLFAFANKRRVVVHTSRTILQEAEGCHGGFIHSLRVEKLAVWRKGCGYVGWALGRGEPVQMTAVLRRDSIGWQEVDSPVVVRQYQEQWETRYEYRGAHDDGVS